MKQEAAQKQHLARAKARAVRQAASQYNALKIKEVKKQGLYAAYIQGKEKPYTIMRTEMGKMKKVNHQTYATQLAAPFDPLAFSACPPASTKQNERKKKSR